MQQPNNHQVMNLKYKEYTELRSHDYTYAFTLKVKTINIVISGSKYN